MRKNTEIRKQQIVDSIWQIISSKGVEYVTIGEIAKSIGTTKTAIYRHFKNKRDILSLLIDSVEETLMKVIGKAMIHEDPLLNLKNILLAHLTFAKRRHQTSFIMIMGVMQLGDPFIRQKIFQLIQKYLRKIERLLSHCVKLNLIENDINIKISAIAFLGLIQSTVTVWSYRNFNFVPEKIHADLWNTYLRGIGVKHP
ncbi:MAG: TetR/AcrR family transcriptional regulator [wastewater metagenome]|nr:TetR/AcrR family transcriptional regulator [Candidatus Loosdrechtia aerotolerans]